MRILGTSATRHNATLEMMTTCETAAADGAKAEWHALPADDCLRLLGVTAEGLTSEEASARRGRFGPNELPARNQPGLILLFLQQFKSPLIYLLLAAAAVSLAIGHVTDAGFIGVVLLLNATIGAFQEGRAEASAAALQKLIRHTARVHRDGKVLLLDSSELVPGDIVEVETGMAAPADVRLTGSSNLGVDESTFSGESLPVRKDAEAQVPSDAGLGDRPTMLHAGTTIVEGRGSGLVVATGLATELGRIESSLFEGAAPPPPLLQRLQRLAQQIAVAAVFLIALLGGILALQGHPLQDVFLLAVALAVSAIPEGLPVAVTVALAAATRRMAKRNVIVRSLPAVEGLGACTLIASDKTGTLTLNRLSVEQLLLPSGRLLGRDDWRSSSHAAAVAAAYCNEAALTPDGDLVGDTVDVALMKFAVEAGIDIARAIAAPRLCQLPYEPALRFAAAAAEGRLYVKGAPETVLPMCADASAAPVEAVEALAASGYRVIAIAGRDLKPDENPDCAAPSELRLLGFAGLLDPIRPEVPDAIARCDDAGIKVRMITGDHPATALTISKQLGLACQAQEVVVGAEIAALENSPDRLEDRVRRGTVFARIEPTQKLTIVQILSRSGETVAVTGDGVNDAPALQAAQIGVAMGRDGTDVAREAADLVLADDNFASIVAGVEEGRITYSNIRKIVIFLLATGIAEIAMFLGAVLAGLPMPLTAVQLLWANLVTNGAQDVMLGFGKGEGDELSRPPRKGSEPVVDRTALALMLPPALFMSAASLVLLYWLLERGHDIESARNAVLLLVVLFQNVYVMSMRSERRPIWREPVASNPWLLLGVTLALLLHIAAMAWPPLGSILGTRLVDSPTLAFCLAAAAVILVVSEATKSAVAARTGNVRSAQARK